MKINLKSQATGNDVKHNGNEANFKSVVQSKIETGKNSGGSELTPTQMQDLPMLAPAFTGTGNHRSRNTNSSRYNEEVELAQGEVLADRYEIVRRLGDGGMGVVYAAKDRLREEEVALKVMRKHLISDPAARERFVNEARVASSLSHPGIVRVFDIHQTNKHTFLTMELLKGHTLRDELQNRAERQQRFTVPEVKQFGQQLCQALSHAHQLTIHRDIKPENIWLCEDGSIKLMDFGIARLMRPSQFASTGLSMGTAYYMAPEQLKAQKDIDHRADQYSTGVVLYELLTGQIPQGAVNSPRELRRSVPSILSKSVMTCLSGNPKDRHPDMKALELMLAKGKSSKGRKTKLVSMAIILVALLASAPWWLPPVKYQAIKIAVGNLVQEVENARQQAMEKRENLEQLQQELKGFEFPLPNALFSGDESFISGDAYFESQSYQLALEQFDSSSTQFDSANKEIEQWAKEQYNKRSRLADKSIDAAEKQEQITLKMLSDAESQLNSNRSGKSIAQLNVAKRALEDLKSIQDHFRSNSVKTLSRLRETFEEVKGERQKGYAESFKQFSDIESNARKYQSKLDSLVTLTNAAATKRRDEAGKLKKQGISKYEDKKYDEAVELFSRALQFDPADVETYNWRGSAYRNNKNYGPALKDYETALDFDPKNAEIFKSRGYLYEQKKEYDLAVEEYTKAINLKPNQGGYYHSRSQMYARLKKRDLALSDQKRAFSLSKERHVAYANRAWVYNELSDYDKALEDCQKSIALKSDYARAFEERGYAYKCKKVYDKAIADLSKAIQLNPGDEDPYLYRAQAYHHKRNYELALKDFAQVIKLEPDDVRNFYERGDTYFQIAFNEKGDYSKALADYQKALQIDPDYYQAYWAIGDVYYNKSDYKLATVFYSKAIDIKKDSARLYLKRGRAFAETEDYRSAINDYKKGLLVDPDNSDLIRQLKSAQKKSN